MRRMSIAILIFMMASIGNLYSQFSVNIVTQPSDIVACKGTADLQLSVVSNTDDPTGLTYQWWRDGQMLVEGVDFTNTTTQAGLILDSLDYYMNGTYVCRVSLASDANTFVDTDPVIVHVVDTPIITRQPMGMATDIGSIAMLDVEGNFRGEMPDYSVSIQWYRNDTIMVMDGAKYSGANSSILLINNVEEADYADQYHVVVTGLCGQVISEKTSVMAMPGASITSQPMSNMDMVCEGNNVMVMISTEAVNGGDADLITYQWYQNGSVLNDNADIAGANSATLTAKVMAGDNDFKCDVIYNRSDVTMSESAMVTGTANAMFTEDLMDVEVTEEDELTIVAPAATGDGDLTYEWYMDGMDDPVATGATFTVASATFSDAGTYWVEVSNECATAQSNQIVVTVNPKQISTGVVSATKYSLTNTPNPFTDNTTISFEITDPTTSELVITDAMGNRIATFSNLQRGLNTINFSPVTYGLSSGVFYFTLTTDGDIATGKMIFNR